MKQRLTIMADKDASISQLLHSRLHLSRHQISRLKFMEDGIRKNGMPARAVDPVKAGDAVSILLYDKKESGLPCPFPVLYEDRWVIVIDKPAGVVVHPSPGHEQDSVQTLLEKYCGLPLHICGRLDKDTSGCLLFSKVDWLTGGLDAQKTYLAWVPGSLETGTVSLPLALHDRKMAVDPSGKRAVTRIVDVKPYGKYSLIQVEIETGRMHQIRCHLAFLGHPLIHDPIYGAGGGRALLHCQRLSFSTPDKRVKVHAPLPADMTYNQKDMEDLG